MLPISQVYDIALIKTTTATQAVAGSDVTFDVVVTNQGTLDAADLTITDYLPAGTTLSSADTVWTYDAVNNTATTTVDDLDK